MDHADPFAAQKLASLAAATNAFNRMLETKLDETDDLAALVMTSLWGNVADLSVSAGDVLVAPEKASAGASMTTTDSMLLADETEALCNALVAARKGVNRSVAKSTLFLQLMRNLYAPNIAVHSVSSIVKGGAAHVWPH